MPKKPSARPESEDSVLVTAAKAIGRAAGRVATIGRSPSEARSTATNTPVRKPATKRRTPTQGKKRKPVKRRAAAPPPSSQDRPTST